MVCKHLANSPAWWHRRRYTWMVSEALWGWLSGNKYLNKNLIFGHQDIVPEIFFKMAVENFKNWEWENDSQKSSTIFIPCLNRTPLRRWSTGSLLSAKNKTNNVKIDKISWTHKKDSYRIAVAANGGFDSFLSEQLQEIISRKSSSIKL